MEERKNEARILQQVSQEGRKRRRTLSEAIEATAHEFQAQGSDMSQRYASTAVYLEDAAAQVPALGGDASS